MITLPRPGTLSRGPLRAFWLALWLLIAVTAAFGASARGIRRAAAVGAAVFVAGAAPGLARPLLARRPYLVWAHGARRAARLITGYVAWVTHTTAIAPERPDEAAHGGSDGGGSGWSPRDTQPPQAYPSASTDPAHAIGPRGVLPGLYGWLRDTGVPRRGWLFVCFAVLRWLQPAGEDPAAADPPTDTYTLY